MKLIIAGSRNISDINIIREALNSNNLKKSKISEIISGGARGVDSLGEEIAKRNNISIKLFPADWDKYGKSAGYKRNCEMAKYGDTLLTIWNGESKGTEHMINIMKKENKEVFIFNTKGDSEDV